MSPKLSIVIMCYHAGNLIRKFLPSTLKVLNSAHISSYEIILVANYDKDSDDITPKVAAYLASKNKKVKCIAKVKRGMMGWDMKSGLSLATGKYIAVIDGDGQMLITDIIKVYKKISDEKLDLVKTYRIKRGDSLWRKIISFSFNILFMVFFPGLKARDINSKPKIFTKEVYKKLDLSSDDWFIDAEIMIQARRFKFRVGEIPTTFLGLTGRRSFVKFPAIIEFIINLCKYRIKEFNY